ncbi:hypothetical protein Rhe02_21140 [Rhizocola hellebori]|uniref:Uncharacterized protein n=1 Tax=Rhizocola hellebori TaxID=1392758 RepID=A0A8J3VFE1_9ACTN|nr:hypothetical protein [Rhizocola hellebori]GIH04047.1 hypothetical protein Rhe02_21140 [Rhizocola hellebori]
MSTLEHRYRRIISLYPVQHRQRFGDEILDTLMQGSVPQQRFPRARELADLLWNAARLRLTRRGLPSVHDSRWADAAAIGGPLAAAFLAAYYALAQIAVWMPILGFAQPFSAPWKAMAAFGWWLLTVVLAAAGARLVAAAMAWLGALGPLAYSAWRYASDATVFARHWPFVVLALTAALCLTVRFPKRHAIQLMGGRFAVLLTAAFVLVWTSPALQLPLIRGAGSDYPAEAWNGLYPRFLGYHLLGAIPLSAVLLLTVTLLWLLLKHDGGLRRRLLAIAAPAVVLSAVVNFGYEQLVMTSSHILAPNFSTQIAVHLPVKYTSPAPVAMSAGQWTFVLLLPPIVFVAALILVRRGDRRQELIELGKAELQRRQAH